jgi:hypothetical protein
VFLFGSVFFLQHLLRLGSFFSDLTDLERKNQNNFKQFNN